MAGKPKYYIDLEERVNTLEIMVLSLQEQLATSAVPVKASTQDSGVRCAGSNKQIRLLVELGEFSTFDVGVAACTPVIKDGEVVRAAFDVNGTLDRWSKLFPFKCSHCKSAHADRTTAFKCATGTLEDVEAGSTEL